MYKKRITKKITAMVMTVVMLFGLLPVPALAAEGKNALPEDAALAGPAASDLMLVGGPNESLWSWAGEKLAGGVMGAIAGKGVDAAMDGIFGSSDRTGEILQGLEDIKEELRNMQGDLQKLSGQVARSELRDDLNKFGEFINDYLGVYNNLNDNLKDYANDPDMAKQFFLDLYSATDQNYLVRGVTLINATLNLGNRLIATQSGGYNIFGAFDRLDKFVNRWEHQGYEQRQAFRNNALSVYTMFSAMSQLACQTIIDNNPGSDTASNSARTKAANWAKQLRANADLVNEMTKHCTVRPQPWARVYRDTALGADLFYFSSVITSGGVCKDTNPLWPEFSQNYNTYGSFDYMAAGSEYFPSIYGTNSPGGSPDWGWGWEYFTYEPGSEDYEKIYKDYGGKYSLYRIFFDDDKGGFQNGLSTAPLPEGTKFATNYYLYRDRPVEGWFKATKYWLTWETHLIDNEAQRIPWYVLSAGYDKGSYVQADRFSDESFFHVWKGRVSDDDNLNANPPQVEIGAEALISGMDLSGYDVDYTGNVELAADKTGDDYQWCVKKGNKSNFEPIAGATSQTYSFSGPFDPAMNGWQYSCAITEDPASEGGEPAYTYAEPVKLSLYGDGIPELVTEHEVADAEKLNEALAKVDSGEWDQHTLILTDDIIYPHPIFLDGMHDLELDLNGHTLTVRPGPDAAPNVNLMSDRPEVAAICLNQDRLRVSDTSTGEDGTLNVIAGPGIAYGIYAMGGGVLDGIFTSPTMSPGWEINVTSVGGGTAIYTDGGQAALCGSVEADGEDAYGVECINQSKVSVIGDITVTGKGACGAYATSFDGGTPDVQVEGGITVSGENSRGVLLNADTQFIVLGNVTVTDGMEGVAVSMGHAIIDGDVAAPNYAINVWGDGLMTAALVSGDVSVSNENAVAVSAVGTGVTVKGNVTSSNHGGIGVLAATWEGQNPSTGEVVTAGAFVTADGKVSAVTPLLIEDTFVTDESEHTEEAAGYYAFYFPEKGDSVVRVKPGMFEAKATSLVTFDKNGGDTEASPATKAAITGGKTGLLPAAPTRIGYTFAGWNTKADGSGTAFTVDTLVTETITVYARWTKQSSGGGDSDGGTPVTQPAIPAANGAVQVNYTASNGTAALTLPTAKVNEIIGKSKDGEAVIDLSGVNGITAASIPKDALTAFAKAGLDVTVKLPVGTITLGYEAAASAAKQASGSNVSIEMKQAAASSLTGEQKKSVKSSDIVLDINIISGTNKISTFEGILTVQIPYTGPQPVAVWYLNDKGELEKLGCTFKNGVVSFDLDHLSLYVVGQDTSKPAWVNPFTDVKDADWFYDAVNFCAEKGITNGTSADTFSPNATLTRGQFITMLLKAYGIETAANPADNFSDAGNTYYTGYLAAAKAKGISNGVGAGKFAPEKAITRQEMFTLLYNALKVLDKLPTADNGKTLADFTDSGDVASWAAEAMTVLVKSGAAAGSGGRLSPAGTTTRAEMAQVLYNLQGK